MSRFKPRENVALAEPAEPRWTGPVRQPQAASLTLSPPVSTNRPKWELIRTTPVQKVGCALNLLFLFLVYSRLIEYGPSSLHLMLIIAGTATLFGLMSGRFLETMTSQPAILLLALTLWYTLTVPFSVWKGGSAQVLVDWGKSVMMFPLLGALTGNSRQLVRTLRFCFYGIFVAAVLAFLYGVTMLDRLQMPIGQYSNPNDLGGAMEAGILYGWFVVHNPRHGKLMHVLGVAGLFCMVAVFSRTGSRGALIGLIAVLPILFLQYSSIGRVRLIIAAVVIAAGALLVTPGAIRGRLASVFISDEEPTTEVEQRVADEAQGSTRARRYLLLQSISLTLRNPVLGVGIGMFPVAEDKFARLQGSRGSWHVTHNTYTQVSSETGFPGLLIFLAILLTDWRILRRLERGPELKVHPNRAELRTVATTLRLLLVSFAVGGLFGSAAYTVAVPVITGLIWSFSRSLREETAPILEAQNKPAAPPSSS